MQEYFVLHLENHRREDERKPFQIQLLDNSLRATSWIYVGFDEQNIEIDGKPVPQIVLDAARRQPLGKGQFVAEDGTTF